MAEHLKALSVYAAFFGLLYLGIDIPEFLTMYRALMGAFVALLIWVSFCAPLSPAIQRELIKADRKTNMMMGLIYWALKIALASATTLSGAPVLAALMVVAFVFVHLSKSAAVNAGESKE